MKTTASHEPDLKDRILRGRLDPRMNFHQRVWTLTARIPAGRVTTYALIAKALGSKAYRAVGQALHHNPYAPEVPCHRVVGSTGSLTGFAHGVDRKAAMLQDEGLTVNNARINLKAINLYDVSKQK